MSTPLDLLKKLPDDLVIQQAFCVQYEQINWDDGTSKVIVDKMTVGPPVTAREMKRKAWRTLNLIREEDNNAHAQRRR